MQFRTELIISPAEHRISLHHRILSIGSCFAEVMGNRLQTYKFRTLVNPFGTIFNPVSMGELLTLAARRQSVAPESALQRDQYWYHYQLHSTFVAENQTALMQQAESVVAETGKFLQRADFLLLTLGTAFVYRLKTTNAIVASCHKMPAQLFIKELLSVGQVTESVTQLASCLQEVHPGLRILLTVSPVRHTKDGITENQVSKSVLRVACHELAASLPQVSYFPAYELVMDDLRDYRFYQADMIHPTVTAEEYIWEKFTAAYLDETAQNFMQQWQKIRQAIAHKPFNPKSAAHQNFLRKTLAQIKEWESIVDVSAETECMEQQLL